jgi:hypothetical protein
VEVARPTAANGAPLSAGGAFYADPMNNQTLNWTHPKASLTVGGAALRQAFFANTTCPATASALSGGIPSAPDDADQALTPLSSIPGILVSTSAEGRLCRYYAPLVHGGNPTFAKDPPATWHKLDNLGPPGVDVLPQHYGNIVTCPAGWFAVHGGGSCDMASKVCNASGGFVTTDWGDVSGTWIFQRMVFWQTGCQAESIDHGVFVDCQEK